MSEAEPVTLANLPSVGAWADKGRCNTAPTELFFPGRGESLTEAKRICGGCPVVADCLAYALPHWRLQGVWGGTSARERRQMLTRQNAGDRAQAETELAPRPAASPRGTMYRALEQLAGHPGRWARIGRYESKESAGALASSLRTGRLPHPPGSWRFEGRLNDVGGSDLYAIVEEPAAAEVVA